MKYKVVITGSTGMVGGILMNQCLENEVIGEVVSLVRKASGIKNSKLTEIVAKDFLNYDNYSEIFKGVDIIFYCLGVYTVLCLLRILEQ
jgi:nucleoside-diphosphate-sugar epimerase